VPVKGSILPYLYQLEEFYFSWRFVLFLEKDIVDKAVLFGTFQSSSVFVKDEEFFEQLIGYQLTQKDSVL